MVFQSRVGVPKDEPGSCDEAYITSSDDGNQVIDIKVEEDSDVKEENDSEQIKSPVTGTESEVSSMSKCPALWAFHQHLEVCIVFVVCISVTSIHMTCLHL